MFENAYSNSPLCAPARATFMSGLLPSRTGVYDNAAEFRSSIPTFAHYLRLEGYRTCLVGQDAFRRAGPAPRLRGAADDRHLSRRFRLDARLVEAAGADRLVVSQHDLGEAGRASPRSPTSSNMTTRSRSWRSRRIFDFARYRDQLPFCLTVSFTHPHDPYAARGRILEPLPRRGHRPAGDAGHALCGRWTRTAGGCTTCRPWTTTTSTRGRHPHLPARLLRQHLLCRRSRRLADGDAARPAGWPTTPSSC